MKMIFFCSCVLFVDLHEYVDDCCFSVCVSKVMVGGREKGKNQIQEVYHNIMCIDKFNGEKKRVLVEPILQVVQIKITPNLVHGSCNFHKPTPPFLL